MQSCIDFQLHDVVRLRLVNGSAADVAAIQRQLGLHVSTDQQQPDFVIRFEDVLADGHGTRILGNWEAGYNDDSFFILRGAHGYPIAVQLPMERLGMPCEIQCRPGLPAMPLLGSIVNLFALAKGFLPLHASAFLYEEQSILVTGWTKGGKTEALLGFAEQGATYVGDEWIFIDPRSDTMRGVPQPIHLWDWHLDSPGQRASLRRSQRFKLAVLRQLHERLKSIAGWQTPIAKTAQRLSECVARQRHVRQTPRRLFGDRIAHVVHCPATVFFMASHESREVEVRPMAIDDIAARMAVSLEHEFGALASCYRQFRFAFPERANALIDQLPALLRLRLAEAFQEKEGMAVWHPYPVSPGALFRAMRSHVELRDGERCGRAVRSFHSFAPNSAHKSAT
jgi:hypothetical protein